MHNSDKNYLQIKALVVGVGGLGGYVCEHLARCGIGSITVMDGDCFDESNLNRQLYCTKETLGLKKALVAEERIKAIGRNATAVSKNFSAEDSVSEFDIVFDCLDNNASRIALNTVCRREGKPLIHGAINGDIGQVAVILPSPKGQGIFSEITKKEYAVSKTYSVVPAVIASLQVNEALKLLNKEKIVEGLLLFDAQSSSIYNLTF